MFSGYKVGQYFINTYLNLTFRYVAFVDKEFGKKLASPYYKFKQANGGSFSCRPEDVQRALRFKDWVPISSKDVDDANVIDI